MILEAIHRSLLALEEVEAIRLDKLRRRYSIPDGKHYRLVRDAISQTIDHSELDRKKLGEAIVIPITMSFNRSLRALKKARAINSKELRKRYIGVGSYYYDIVTARMESCIPRWLELVEHYENTGKILEKEITSIHR